MAAPHSTASRVLIYRLGSLGDTVVALPCLHLIARTFPNAERRLLTNLPVHAKAPLSAAVLENSGLVHGYIPYPIGLRNLGSLLALRRQIRAFRPDVLVYLAAVRSEKAVRRDLLFFRLCGIPLIVGQPTQQEQFQRQPLAAMHDAAWHLYEHEASRLSRCMAPVGDAAWQQPASWNLCVTPDENQAALRALGELGANISKPILAVGAGTKLQSKDWEPHNWRALLDRLAVDLPNHTVILVGAAEEAELSDQCSQAWMGRRVNLCGKLSPRETAAALAHAELYLGADSGPMHLAAAMQVPCVAVFSGRNLPGEWWPVTPVRRVLHHVPECGGCRLETCIEQSKKCILSITVDEVAAAVHSALQEIRSVKESRA
jgi:ADP-heptose:LPS heptosyltransferase